MRVAQILNIVATFSATLQAAMPAVQQNALVAKYCAVCHTDAARNGGLSLQHYDTTQHNPALAAMILSKLNGGAMGAAGKGVPETATQQAWLNTTTEQALGAREWFVSHNGEVVTASIVREVSPREPQSPHRPVYRLRIACDASTGAGEMQLTWSPQPQTGRGLLASVDGQGPVEYRIEGRESMGNGAIIQSGHASVFLSNDGNRVLPLSNQSLEIRELFPGETVNFPFSELDPKVTTELRRCF